LDSDTDWQRGKEEQKVDKDDRVLNLSQEGTIDKPTGENARPEKEATKEKETAVCSRGTKNRKNGSGVRKGEKSRKASEKGEKTVNRTKKI